jgi:hypothetical protein
MQQINGLRVTVQGDLPAEVMQRVADGVRRGVLRELAEIDLTPELREVPLDSGVNRDFDEFGIKLPFLLGLVLKPVDLQVGPIEKELER